MLFDIYLAIGCFWLGFGLWCGAFDDETPVAGQIAECVTILLFWPVIVYLIWKEF